MKHPCEGPMKAGEDYVKPGEAALDANAEGG